MDSKVWPAEHSAQGELPRPATLAADLERAGAVVGDGEIPQPDVLSSLLGAVVAVVYRESPSELIAEVCSQAVSLMHARAAVIALSRLGPLTAVAGDEAVCAELLTRLESLPASESNVPATKGDGHVLILPVVSPEGVLQGHLAVDCGAKATRGHQARAEALAHLAGLVLHPTGPWMATGAPVTGRQGDAGRVADDWRLDELIAILDLLVPRLRATVYALQRREARLFDLDRQLAAITRALPDLVFIQDLDGTFLSYHCPPWFDLYRPPSEFLGRNQRDILPPAVGELFAGAFAEIARGAPQITLEYELEVRGTLLAYEARVVALDERRGLNIIRDVTALRRAQAEVALREARLRGFLETFHGIVLELTAGGEACLLCAGQAAEITGHPPSAFLSGMVRWCQLVHPQDRWPAGDPAGQAAAGKRTYRIVRRDGDVRWVEERWQTTVPVPGVAAVRRSTIYDVTSRREAEIARARYEAQRDQFVARAIRADEDERTRVARALHGGIAQVASSLAMRLGMLTTASNAANLQACGALVDRLIAEVRNLASSVQPLPLAELGLEAALVDLARRLSERFAPAEVEVLFPPGAPGRGLSSPLATSLYRVLQDALEHALEHRRCRHASLVAAAGGQGLRLVLEITDCQRVAAASFELQGVHERCGLLGATVQVDSAGPHETWVFDVPLAAADAEPPP